MTDRSKRVEDVGPDDEEWHSANEVVPNMTTAAVGADDDNDDNCSEVDFPLSRSVVHRTNLSYGMTTALSDYPLMKYCSHRDPDQRPSLGQCVNQGLCKRTFETDYNRGRRFLPTPQEERGGNVLTYGLPSKRDGMWTGVVQRSTPNWQITASNIQIHDSMLAPIICEEDSPHQTLQRCGPSFCHQNTYTVCDATRLDFDEDNFKPQRGRAVASYTYGPRQYPGQIDSERSFDHTERPEEFSHPQGPHAATAMNRGIYRPDDYYRSTDRNLWNGQANSMRRDPYVDELDHARPDFRAKIQLEDSQITLPRPGGPDDYHRPMKTFPNYTAEELADQKEAEAQADEKRSNKHLAKPNKLEQREASSESSNSAHSYTGLGLEVNVAKAQSDSDSESPTSSPRNSSPSSPPSNTAKSPTEISATVKSVSQVESVKSIPPSPPAVELEAQSTSPANNIIPPSPIEQQSTTPNAPVKLTAAATTNDDIKGPAGANARPTASVDVSKNRMNADDLHDAGEEMEWRESLRDGTSSGSSISTVRQKTPGAFQSMSFPDSNRIDQLRSRHTNDFVRKGSGRLACDAALTRLSVDRIQTNHYGEAKETFAASAKPNPSYPGVHVPPARSMSKSSQPSQTRSR